MAAIKIVPRRPIQWFIGSASQPMLYARLAIKRGKKRKSKAKKPPGITHRRAMEIYGAALMKPTIH
jgi:hypothetical protein